MELEITSYLFNSPTNISVSGTTSSGKTWWVRRLLKEKDRLFEHPPEHIIYCYGVWQDTFTDMHGIDFHMGLPANPDEVGDGKRHTLLIVDDLMDAVVRDEKMQQMFVRGSHHRNITIIFLNQNMFCPGKHARTINLNCHYLVLFRNARDVQQVGVLSKQLGMGTKLIEAYKDATSEPYGYLVVDLSPHNHTQRKLKSHVFTEEDMVVYL